MSNAENTAIELAKTIRDSFVKLSGDGSYADITLSKPFTIAGAKVSALRMREPTIGDQINTEHLEKASAQEIQLFANLLEQSPEDVKRLPVRDYKRIQDAFSVFTD